MRPCELTSLESRFTFGRYKGLTLADVMDINPDYVVWCVTTVEQLLLYDNAVTEIRIVYPHFPIYVEFEQRRQWNFDRYYHNQCDDCSPYDLVDDDYDNHRSCDDEPTYDRYSGTYAQDVAGYSDDDIDTIFDGEPDAYWNID